MAGACVCVDQLQSVEMLKYVLAGGEVCAHPYIKGVTTSLIMALIK